MNSSYTDRGVFNVFRYIRMLAIWSYILCVIFPTLLLSVCSHPLSRIAKEQLWKEKSSDEAARLAKPPLIARQELIILDPGHGGHDVGTQSIAKPRYQEKSLNLVTAQFVKDYLQQSGYRVLMTRENDLFVSLDHRAEFVNKHRPSVFVSIHYNAAPSAEAQGVEIFFYPSKANKGRLVKSKRLAHCILKQVIKQTKAKSRGVKQGNYLVIRQVHVPAVLIEGGFVTNEAELEKLKDPTYLKRLAWGIARGVEDYLNKRS
jgi:N-acetylmuramoyl-L-alanine amidase